MANAVRCPIPLHSVMQDEIYRIGAKQTAADARQAAPRATTGS